MNPQIGSAGFGAPWNDESVMDTDTSSVALVGSTSPPDANPRFRVVTFVVDEYPSPPSCVAAAAPGTMMWYLQRPIR